MAAHVKQIADIVHAHDAVLLVDEAHGPHLGFHQGLPPSAMQCGADMAAQSTHKILGALTQCSLLQVKGTRIDLQHAADVMSLLTTTSPNYLLMGSLDAARAQLAERGTSMMEDALHAARILRNELQKIPGLQVIGPEQVVGKFGVAALDLTKVAINVKDWPCSGIEAGEQLRKDKIAVELVDPQNVLFLVTYGDWAPVQWQDTVEKICRSLRKLCPAKNPLEVSGEKSAGGTLCLENAGRRKENGCQERSPADGISRDGNRCIVAKGFLRKKENGFAAGSGWLYLRRAGELLPTGDSGDSAGRTVYGRNHSLVRCYEKTGSTRQRAGRCYITDRACVGRVRKDYETGTLYYHGRGRWQRKDYPAAADGPLFAGLRL